MSKSPQSRSAAQHQREPDPALVAAAEALRAKECAAANRRTATRVSVVRTVLGTALLVAALALGGFSWLFTATSRGAVAGSVVTYVAPTSGVVDSIEIDVGDSVEPGQIAARIRNERVDQSRLDELRNQRVAANARLAAANAEIANKTRERDRQLVQLNKQRAFIAIDIERRIREATAVLESFTESRMRADSEFRAMDTLREKGFISRLGLERARESSRAAGKAVEAQVAALARLQNRADALQAGIVIDAEFPVPQSRVDDLGVRLAEFTVVAEEMRANLARLDQAIEAQAQQVTMRQEALVRNAVRGRVWKRLVTNGQHVLEGTPLLEVIDAASIRVEALLHQRHLGDVAVGDAVVVSPVGSREKLNGKVVLIGAAVELSVVAPRMDLKQEKQDKAMRVVISLDAKDRHAVWVGQQATILIGAPSFARTRGLHAALARLTMDW